MSVSAKLPQYDELHITSTIPLCDEVCNYFAIAGRVINIARYGEGHINETYLVRTDIKRYILQKINNKVFTDIDGLMKNIFAVTTFLNALGIESLRVVPSKIGGSYTRYRGAYWRMYDFVENTVTYQKVESEKMFENVGGAFGKFQNALSDFDPSTLKETIVDFHDTPKRYERFLSVLASDRSGRADICKAEIAFLTERRGSLDKITSALTHGDIPYRVTHNDTKLNNILMDADSGKPRAVIDLDTVMCGSLLYDFGDAIRFGASTAAEDERDLDKVHFSIGMFEAFARGYCEAVKNSITPKEIELLPYCVYLMTLECGMRFLTDYLDGDTYFAIKYPDHNLVRTRTQFKLVSDIELNMKKISQIVNDLFIGGAI